MARPWVENGGHSRGRRPPSPPYYHEKDAYGSSYDGYHDGYHDGYGDRRSRPLERRSSVRSEGRRSLSRPPPDRPRYEASTYRPSYNRHSSEDSLHREYHQSERALEERPKQKSKPKPTAPVSNKVWVNPEFLKKQLQQRERAVQGNCDGAASEPGDSSARPVNSSTLELDGDASSTSAMEKAVDPAIENEREEDSSSPMELEGTMPHAVENTLSDEARPQNRNSVQHEQSRPPIPFQIRGAAAARKETTMNGQQVNTPPSWLRPKRKDTLAGGESTTDAPNGGEWTEPSSPVSPRAKHASTNGAQNSKIADMLQNFFVAATQANVARQELEKTKKLLNGTMKDLLLIHGNEEAAKAQAQIDPHVASLLQKQHQQETDVSASDGKSRATANHFAVLFNGINDTAKKDEGTRTSVLEDEVSKVRHDNDNLKVENAKLESRLSKLEALLQTRENDSSQLNEVNAAISSMKSDVSSLTLARDTLIGRMEQCETSVETLNHQASSSANVNLQQLERSRQSHEQSMLDMQERMDQLANRHTHLSNGLDTFANEQREKQEVLKQQVLTEAQALCERSASGTRDHLLRIQNDQKSLENNTIPPLVEHLSVLNKQQEIFDSRILRRESEYSNILTKLEAQIRELKKAVTDQPPIPTSATRSNIQSPPLRTTNAPGIPSQTQNTSQHPNMAMTFAQANPQLVAQYSTTNTANTSAWHSRASASMSPTTQTSANDLGTRLQRMEMFVQSHEHRLNFTTIESCWAPLVQHVMAHIAQNYRYPETVATSLSELQRTTQAHSQYLNALTNQIDELRAKSGDESQKNTIAQLKSQLEAQSRAIQSVKSWTEAEIKDLVMSAINGELEQAQALRKDLSERMRLAMTEFEQSTASSKQVLAQLSERAAAVDTTSSTDNAEVDKKMQKLTQEVDELQDSWVVEISTIHGHIARVEGRLEALIQKLPGVADMRSIQATPKKSAAPLRRNTVPNNHQAADGSSSDSLIDSKRKRKRKE